MKLAFLLLLAFSAVFSTVSAAQVWVNGVTAENGWIDYEKNPAQHDGDDLLCWAASASNIIDYWQQQYVVPTNTPTGEAIWERFKSACTMDTGGHFIYAVQWWLGGDYEGTTLYNDNEDDLTTIRDNRAIARHTLSANRAIITDLDTFDGYYWDCFDYDIDGETYDDGKQGHLYNFLYGNASFSSIGEQIIAELAAPMSLSILDTNNKLAHAITLWGMDYTEDASGNISINSIWITDSDDYTHQLKQIFTYYKEDDSRVYLTDYVNHPLYGDIYLDSAYGINTAESDTWNLVRAVPEPTTATLSLLGLAGLLARRRRK